MEKKTSKMRFSLVPCTHFSRRYSKPARSQSTDKSVTTTDTVDIKRHSSVIKGVIVIKEKTINPGLTQHISHRLHLLPHSQTPHATPSCPNTHTVKQTQRFIAIQLFQLTHLPIDKVLLQIFIVVAQTNIAHAHTVQLV